MKHLLTAWQTYLRESYDMAGEIAYTAVVLDDASKAKLAALAPPGWRVYADHMTIIPPQQQAGGPRYSYPLYPLGSEVQLEAVGLARNEKVMAVLVHGDVPTKGDIPHVTVATNGGRPADSKRFRQEDYVPLQEPLHLSGKVSEVLKSKA